ncbi:MAG: efflux transporter periplasmic adaptor subunit [Ramlibacter sp.]|jgi:RND family efflux transporter MFP subunit|nr:efflux transporter periplasmic adaptor subunit [Ramlibacter sp.]
MNRRVLRWLAVAVAVLVLGAGLLRVVSARKEQQEAVARASQQKAQAVVELAPSDVVRAQQRELSQGLPVSGSLRAVNSAAVKARAAGELQGLTVREGDAVRAGQLVARIDATEYQARLRQAQQQADSARSQIDIAQRQYDNNKALMDQGFISRSALDTSLNNLQAAQANHKAADAAVDLARKALDDTQLRAPIAGVVSQRLAQPGERVGVDARVIEIVDLGRLELEATLSAADSMDVRVGQQARLQVEGSSQPVAARVARINPSAQAGSRSVLVYLTIENGAGLRQGLFAQGTLGIGQASALAIPLSAIRTDKPQPYVQLVEDNRIAHRSVQTGARGQSEGELMAAVQGIAPGALVIKGNLGPLREGTPVRFTGSLLPGPLPRPAEGARPARSPSP